MLNFLLWTPTGGFRCTKTGKKLAFHKCCKKPNYMKSPAGKESLPALKEININVDGIAETAS